MRAVTNLFSISSSYFKNILWIHPLKRVELPSLHFKQFGTKLGALLMISSYQQNRYLKIPG